MKKYMDTWVNTTGLNETFFSYRRLYPELTALNGGNADNPVDFTPEVHYFTQKAGLDDCFPSDISFNKSWTFNFTEILANMNNNKLLNQGMWGDLLLNVSKKSQKLFETD